jgi:hypothetical protein
MKQQTLAVAAQDNTGFEQHRRPTRRDQFLATMEQIVPWAELCGVIEPHYPKAGNGRPPVGLQRMLRMYFVQHWFNLADAACEDALLDSPALLRFVGHRPGPRARARRDHAVEVSAPERHHDDWRYEFYMHDDAEREFYSQKLLKKARRLRVLVPPRYEGSNLTSDYEESNITGLVHLTLQGENKVRASIREEQKHRWEGRSRLIPFISLLIGLIGVITGLVAVLIKRP